LPGSHLGRDLEKKRKLGSPRTFRDHLTQIIWNYEVQNNEPELSPHSSQSAFTGVMG
jgi:hypothetical protein